MDSHTAAFLIYLAITLGVLFLAGIAGSWFIGILIRMFWIGVGNRRETKTDASRTLQ